MLATTENGLRVKLNDNGTWEEIKVKEETLDDYSVRKVIWGMGHQQVINSEDIILDTENSDMYIGELTISGLASLLAYDFINEELYSVRYIFINEHSDDGDFVHDFNTLQNNLIKKYGKADEENRYFTDELYDDIPAEWGMALGRNKLTYFTTWKTKDTEITLALYGDNGEIKFNLSYSSIKHKHNVEQYNENTVLDDL